MLPDGDHYAKMLEVKNELAKHVSERDIAVDQLRSQLLKNHESLLPLLTQNKGILLPKLKNRKNALKRPKKC